MLQVNETWLFPDITEVIFGGAKEDKFIGVALN
jgi:hypothetical protein